ncbi:MAG: excisionase family DNA-binding protein [Tractidigestivibacter sp.]|uniref:excisionase family DNA-binding protein n=1 Tax=Tractidigestivibacter sp. TaxID=2847320 RepID=UPI002A821A6C|nr:excisionase family DNA-binding protein [Tractidigestivibacter sp.]MCI6273929.1 excisionase family DNA-binding protein [Coriobacteriaceae bacterium]MDY4534188.1 excisionase family DNA-binding protein [Tractidigestivibacter sp.]
MGADPIDAYLRQVDELGMELRRRLSEAPMPCGSRSLSFAVEAGLPPARAYTVSETARYSGIDARTLRAEHEAGRLRFVMPNGATKGYRISVDEMDRWMEASQR